MKFKVGDVVRLNLMTISPIYATVVEVGNTYVVINVSGRLQRVSSRRYHFTFMRNLDDA